jgi:hypothetical protein
MSLLIHCGAEACSLDRLQEIETPEGTKTHKPVSHYDLVEMVKEALPEHGMVLDQEEHAISRDSMNYFGILGVHDADTPLDELKAEHRRVIGVRNSNTKRFGVGIVGGTSVLVCDNLSFCGEHKHTRKHTVHVLDFLPDLIATSLKAMKPMFEANDARIDAYKDCEINSQRAADHMFMNLLREDVLSGARLKKASDHWQNPEHEEFSDRNLWSFYNSVTHAHKGLGVRTMYPKSIKLQSLCDKTCNFSV